MKINYEQYRNNAIRLRLALVAMSPFLSFRVQGCNCDDKISDDDLSSDTMRVWVELTVKGNDLQKQFDFAFSFYWREVEYCTGGLEDVLRMHMSRGIQSLSREIWYFMPE